MFGHPTFFPVDVTLSGAFCVFVLCVLCFLFLCLLLLDLVVRLAFEQASDAKIPTSMEGKYMY